MTLKNAVTFQGIGIHTGKEGFLKINPAPPGTGLVFKRRDLKGAEIKALVSYVKSSERGTTLEANGIVVNTVEHVLAALYGLAIDDAILELDGPEIPALDGSAKEFVEKILQVGIEDNGGSQEPLAIQEVIKVQERDTSLVMLPFQSGLKISYAITYPHPILNNQFASFDINKDIFTQEIAPARTFTFLEEVKPLKDKGLGGGGSLDNTVVVTKTGYLNGPLRYPNEPVRHKILDLLGDLALLGKRIKHAHIVALHTGHTQHIQLVNLLAQKIHNSTFTIHDILQCMPHRYPFLLVDRILSLSSNKVVGIKNVTYNEPFFFGHFPTDPVMPGVLVLEAMAQVGGFLLMKLVEEKEKKLLYISAIDCVKFREPVRPGDQLYCELTLVRFGGRFAKMEGIAKVAGHEVAKATFTAALVKRP